MFINYHGGQPAIKELKMSSLEVCMEYEKQIDMDFARSGEYEVYTKCLIVKDD
jgi:hypothetical protein